MLFAHTINKRVKVWAVARVPPLPSATPPPTSLAFSFSNATTTATASGGVSHVFHLPVDDLLPLPDSLPEIHLVADISSSLVSPANSSHNYYIPKPIITWVCSSFCPGSELTFLQEKGFIRATCTSSSSFSSSSAVAGMSGNATPSSSAPNASINAPLPSPSPHSSSTSTSAATCTSPLVKSHGDFIGTYIAIATLLAPSTSSPSSPSDSSSLSLSPSPSPSPSPDVESTTAVLETQYLYDIRLVPINAFSISPPVLSASSSPSPSTLTPSSLSLVVSFCRPLSAMLLVGRFAANGLGSPVSIEGACMNCCLHEDYSSYHNDDDVVCTAVSACFSSCVNAGNENSVFSQTQTQTSISSVLMSCKTFILKGFNNDSGAQADKNLQQNKSKLGGPLVDLLPHHGHNEAILRPFPLPSPPSSRLNPEKRHDLAGMAVTLISPSSTSFLNNRAAAGYSGIHKNFQGVDAQGFTEEGIINLFATAKSDAQSVQGNALIGARAQESESEVVSVLRCMYLPSSSSSSSSSSKLSASHSYNTSPLTPKDEKKKLVALRKRRVSNKQNQGKEGDEEMFDIAVWSLQPCSSITTTPFPILSPLPSNPLPQEQTSSSHEEKTNVSEFCTLEVTPDPHFGLGLRLDLVGGKEGTDGARVGGSVIVHSFKRNPLHGGPLAVEASGCIDIGDELVKVSLSLSRIDARIGNKKE